MTLRVVHIRHPPNVSELKRTDTKQWTEKLEKNLPQHHAGLIQNSQKHLLELIATKMGFDHQQTDGAGLFFLQRCSCSADVFNEDARNCLCYHFKHIVFVYFCDSDEDPITFYGKAVQKNSQFNSVHVFIVASVYVKQTKKSDHLYSLVHFSSF